MTREYDQLRDEVIVLKAEKERLEAELVKAKAIPARYVMFYDEAVKIGLKRNPELVNFPSDINYWDRLYLDCKELQEKG